MLFDWDDPKSDRDLRERGLISSLQPMSFDGETDEFVDDRRSYGEIRISAFGFIEEQTYAVIYTQRDDVRWIISSFRYRKRELERWKRRAAAR